MSKFFIKKTDICGKIATLKGEDVGHVRKVLRLEKGDHIILCDGENTDYECVIENIDKDSLTARVENSHSSESEPFINVTLYQGLPKSDKMDYIIQKSVEIGVKTIIPVITERTVVKIGNETDSSKKTTRWRKIAVEAAKQSGRGAVPFVSEPITFAEALKLAQNDQLKLMPYEKEKNNGLKSIINDNIIDIAENDIRNIAVLIGPEGGFTEDETAEAIEGGFFTVTFGPRILRTDTAGLYVLSVLMYEMGDRRK